MKRFENRPDTPMWYILTVAFVLAALIGFSMIFPYVRIRMGGPLDITPYDNPHIWEKVSPIVSYAKEWGSTDIAGAFICLFLGLVCFLLGATRSLNKLSGKQIYMQGLFLLLFAINTLSMIESFTANISQEILFYTCWITFFLYPIPLFIYYFLYFAPDFQKWTWPLLTVPILFSAAAFAMFFISGLPLDVPGKLYTPVSVFCFVVFLLLGLFGVRKNSMAWFVRAISGFWFGWACYVFIKNQIGYSFYIHNEFKTGVIISAVLIVCFLVFFSSQEVVSYKSDVQLLSLQNRMAKASYEQIKSHLKEVGGLKHEVKNHIIAMQIYLNDGLYKEAQNYLAQFSEQVNSITEAVYPDNILINAVVGNFFQSAREHGVKVELNLKASPIGIADPDLYSLLSNILENALEACARVPDGCERFIRLSITRREPYFNIYCENSRADEIINNDGVIQTTKRDRAGHGYGLWTIGRIVDAYNGIMDIDYGDGIFAISAALKDR